MEISAEKEKLQKKLSSRTEKWSIWKNLLDEINGRLKIAKERLLKLRGRSIEIVQAEE